MQLVFGQSRLRVSLITCAAGNDLYSIFGHTAIRIYDSATQQDAFYNYGTFNFDDPNFYTKFIQGKLDYFLSVENGADFLQSYSNEGRTVFEQVLYLTTTQKTQLQQALQQNLQGDNKYYKYDFLFDNCTTRARDMLAKNTGLTYNYSLVAPSTTFRNMLYVYLDSGRASWSKLGIDILLGSKIDKPINTEQATFLPSYLMRSVDSFNIKNTYLQERNVYAPIQKNEPTGSNYLPLMVIGLWSFIVIFWANVPSKFLQKMFTGYCYFVLLLTGIMGVLLLFMWFGTNHNACGDNYNLLWALPTNLIALFFIHKKTQGIKNYLIALLVINSLMVVLWFLLPQQFNIALFPFVFSNIFCYKHLLQRVKNKTS